MGAQGSKAGQAEGTNQETAVDYYTLLEVSEDATQDEIRVGKLGDTNYLWTAPHG